mgnify:CR=1 FL=1
MTMKIKTPLLLSCLFGLFACNPTPTINELCETHNDVCEEFIADSWCKAERKQILLGYHELELSNIDVNKYRLLIKFEDYKDCMSHAAKIEHIKLKEKQTYRIQNKEKALEKIQQLSEETKNSDDPYLLYYHWSRYLNKDALAKFKALEGSHQLETPELQFFLATYYTKIDDKKTLMLLYHALELYQEGDEINVELLKSLITIFTDKKEYKKAYIWLKVLYLYQPDDNDISEKSLSDFAQLHRLNAEFLDKVASSTLDKIESGQFTSPKL